VKLFLKLPESTVKGNVTSSKEPPQVEIENRKNEKTEFLLQGTNKEMITKLKVNNETKQYAGINMENE
jgi:hypothetical protein